MKSNGEMNTEDKDKLRRISFKEFADRWLDSLDKEYDQLGDAWIETFRPEILSHLRALGERVDTLIALLSHLSTEEAMQAFVAEFGQDTTGGDIPAYESLLPAIRVLGGKDDDSALAIIGIFRYAANTRRPGSTAGDNIRTD